MSFVHRERTGKADKLLGHEVRVRDEREVTAIREQLPTPEREASGKTLATLWRDQEITLTCKNTSRDRHAAEAARKV
jgi:hypothetical protein